MIAAYRSVGDELLMVEAEPTVQVRQDVHVVDLHAEIVFPVDKCHLNDANRHINNIN